MAKQGLNKIWILKDQLGLICEGRKEPVEREGREEEEEEEEEEKKKEGSSQDQAKRGMELGFLVWKLTLFMNSMRFGMYFWVCMRVILLKPRVLLGFHLSPKFVEIKVGITTKNKIIMESFLCCWIHG